MRTFALLALPLLSVVSVPAQEEASASQRAPYAAVASWPKLPAGFQMHEASGVDVDSEGDVWFFHRGEKMPIMEFDAETGELKSSFADGMIVHAHGLEIDQDDNVWVTDQRAHTVMKFTPEGELLMTIGVSGEAGLDNDHFDQPTDVVIAPNGDFYVSDGYGNSRVVKFNKDGKFLMTWGTPGDGPGEFSLPHGLTLDRQGRVYVADRNNLRIQVFDADGKFLSQWKHTDIWDRPWGMELAPDGNSIFIMDGGDARRQEQDNAATGHVIQCDLNGNVLDIIADGYGSEPGQLYWGHDVSIGPDWSIYTVEVRVTHRPQKFVRPDGGSAVYRTDGDWAKLPAPRVWGSTSAVYPAADGINIWVGERCGENTCVGHDELDPILLFNPAGEVIRSFGKGMIVWPHGIHVDPQGNVWMADAQGEGNRGHQVHKFSPEGELLMSLGQAGVAGAGEDTFNQPSDVLVAPDGSIFVVDGHGARGNNRTVKFDKDGKFIKQWGQTGTADGDFRDPHALAMDSQGRLFVADRANSRLQIFDQDGNHLDTWHQFGRPSGLYIDENDILYSADSESNARTNPGFKRGIRIGSVKDGVVIHLIEDPAPRGATSAAEGVAVDAMGNIFGAEVGPRRLVKYTKN